MGKSLVRRDLTRKKGTMMTMVTDMNDRERKRYAKQIEAHIEACTELLNALRASDDMKALIALVRVSLDGRFVNELIEVFQGAENVHVPDHP